MHGRPLEMILTPGQQHDCTVADRLIDFITGDACLADGSYDTNAILDELHQRGIEAVIPSGQERKKKRRHDKELYKQRYLVETAQTQAIKTPFALPSIAACSSWLVAHGRT